ncbi:hypothetical protein Tco_0137456, partial [Tanacetum coccineum]
DKDQGEVDSSIVTSGVSIPVSDPEKAHEALAGPDPEPMQKDQTGSNSGKLHMKMPWISKLQSRLKTTRESMIVMMKKTMMMMKALQLDHTRVGQQREEDPNLPLLGQFSLLRKMINKVQRNYGSLMHLLPNNIQLLPQLDGKSLTQEMMLLTL